MAESRKNAKSRTQRKRNNQGLRSQARSAALSQGGKRARPDSSWTKGSLGRSQNAGRKKSGSKGARAYQSGYIRARRKGLDEGAAKRAGYRSQRASSGASGG